MLSARNGHLEAVLSLIKNGADVEATDVHGQTALFKAVRATKLVILRALLDAKANCNHADTRGATPMHMAVEMDNGEIIQLLHDFGGRLEAKTNSRSQFPNMTPLRLSCSINSMEATATLLELGADVNSRDDKKATPMLAALSRKKAGLLKLVLDYGPNLYVTSSLTEGVLPLSYAAGKLGPQFLKLLIDAKVDVNRPDVGGKTALHFAARTNNVNAVKFLLANGADYTIRDKAHRDAAQYGKRYGATDAVKVLEAAWTKGGGSGAASTDPMAGVKKSYTILKKLGEGAFGKVLLVKHKRTGVEYACKFIKRKKLSESSEAYLDTEIEIMRTVPHSGICQLHEVIKSKLSVCLILEVLRGGDVLRRIVENDMLNEREAARVIRSVASTLGFLHNLGIIHRDLKPDNLMYRSEAKDSTVVIVDFGVAKHLADAEEYANSACGTPLYLAPEVITGPRYTHACDMWSLGVIMYVMLSGRPPFFAKDRGQLFKKIKAGAFKFPAKYWKDVSEDAKDLIRKLLVLDPKKRIGPTEIAKHPWIMQESGLQFQMSVTRVNQIASEAQNDAFDEGCAALERAVNFLVSVRRFCECFDIGKVDGNALRILGAMRQRSMMTNRRGGRGRKVDALKDSPRRSYTPVRGLEKLRNELSSKPLSPMMVVKVRGFDGQYVLERQYEGSIGDMKDHWWVTGPEGQMHVAAATDIVQVDKKGRALISLKRQSSYKPGASTVDVSDVRLSQDLEIAYPPAKAGRKLRWSMLAPREDLVDIMNKEYRVLVMFWNHLRLFQKQFLQAAKDSKEDPKVVQLKMVSEARRIQLMFLKPGASLTVKQIPDEVLRALDTKITKQVVSANMFASAIRQCYKLIKSSLWENLNVLATRFREKFEECKKTDMIRSISMTKRLSLVLPRRLLSLMGTIRPPNMKTVSSKALILEGNVRIASVVDEEATDDLRGRIEKILESKKYNDLEVLAKVVGEGSELLVPGRSLEYANMVRKKSGGLFGSMSERMLVLCNDVIAWFIPQKLKMRHYLPLNEFTFETVADDPCRFIFVHKPGSKKKSYEFVVQTATEVKIWQKFIAKKQAEFKEQKSQSQNQQSVLESIKNSKERTRERLKRRTLRELVRHLKHGVEIKDRNARMKSHADCFVGEEAVKWMLAEELVPNENAAVQICNDLLVHNYIEHVTREHGFRNNKFLYRINGRTLRAGSKAGAITNAANGGTLGKGSMSRSAFSRAGASNRIRWTDCRASIRWKAEGRSDIPLPVLVLAADDFEGPADEVPLQDAAIQADAKEATKLRVIPGGQNVTDSLMFEEYQIQCDSEKERDEWVKNLSALATDKKQQIKTLMLLIERVANRITTVVSIFQTHVHREVGDAKAAASVLAKDDETTRVLVGGKMLPISTEVAVLKPNTFFYPTNMRAALEATILESVDAFFGLLMEDLWSDQYSSLLKLVTTQTRISEPTSETS